MKLSRHIVRMVLALIAIALAGMTYLQYRLLRNTIELKETTFRNNVTAALNFATEKLEEIDARNRLFPITDSTHVPHAAATGKDSTIVITSLNAAPRFRPVERRTTGASQPTRMTVRAFNMLGKIDTTIVDTFTTRASGTVRLPKDKYSGGVFFVQFQTDSATSTIRLEGGRQSYAYTVTSGDVRRGTVMKRIAESFAPPEPVPLAKKYPRELVDSVLSAALAKNGIALPFEFALFSNDTLALGRTTMASADLRRAGYTTALMSLEPSPVREALTVYFPGIRSYLFTSYLPELGASLGLMTLLIFCFASTISIIVRQRTFAERLSDFINNMTHEFKTPLSTISLATEALAKPEIRASDQKVERYNQIITDEHGRMRTQVDKILQMAALEEHETEFDMAPVDMHRIIEQAAAQFGLLVRSKGGTIAAELCADAHIITGDALHIENVVRNLLDNAVKYSHDAPAITIRTSNDGRHLLVTITDAGIGIAPEHHARVFEKYYRVPTGNLHDVKGFGLGLSYVKLITDAHGGSISIESRPGKGTAVALRFPCVDEKPNDARP